MKSYEIQHKLLRFACWRIVGLCSFSIQMKMNIRPIKKFIEELYERDIKADLSYHGYHHVMDVLNACNEHIKRLKIKGRDAHILRVSALLHDTGILWQYTNHEDRGIEFAKQILPEWGYNQQEISQICQLIKATQLPQQPNSLLENIICDADLDYLGTDKFYEIGQTLYDEFRAYKVVKNEEEWDRLQVNFLENHHYHTDYCKRYREPNKQARIREIKDKWGW